jgi:putative ATPase
VKEHGTLPVPHELRNAPTPMMKSMGYGSGYRYPHDYEGSVVPQQYRPPELGERRYYEPSEAGDEAETGKRLKEWAEQRTQGAVSKKR